LQRESYRKVLKDILLLSFAVACHIFEQLMLLGQELVIGKVIYDLTLATSAQLIKVDVARHRLPPEVEKFVVICSLFPPRLSEQHQPLQQL
jgi:hypothetical protein